MGVRSGQFLKVVMGCSVQIVLYLMPVVLNVNTKSCEATDWIDATGVREHIFSLVLFYLHVPVLCEKMTDSDQRFEMSCAKTSPYSVASGLPTARLQVFVT